MTTILDDSFHDLRKKTGLSLEELANTLSVSFKTVERWDSGKAQPKEMISNFMKAFSSKINENAKNSGVMDERFTFIDLFAGIGGIRIPFQELGGKCVFTSEWDKFSQKTYAANFGEIAHGDITKISAKKIPHHDILLAGFPCQTFSQAGLKKGFYDPRGTMFFEIQKILSHHRPKAFLLENVKQLKGHDKGRTLKTILDILEGGSEYTIPKDVSLSEELRKSLEEKLNYWVDFRVLRAADFGVPQNRERVYIVGINKDHYPNSNFDDIFQWPEPKQNKVTVGDILQETVDDKYTISDKLWAGHQRRKKEHKLKGNGFGYCLFTKDSPYTSTISARYYKDGSEILIDQSHLGKNPRKLTPRECARLQGFSENFNISTVSDAQAYRQFGNSVAVPAVRAVAHAMLATMEQTKVSKKAA